MWTNQDPNDVELWQIDITTLGLGALIRLGWATSFGGINQSFRLFAGLPLLLSDASGAVLVRVTPPTAPQAALP